MPTETSLRSAEYDRDWRDEERSAGLGETWAPYRPQECRRCNELLDACRCS